MRIIKILKLRIFRALDSYLASLFFFYTHEILPQGNKVKLIFGVRLGIFFYL